MNFIMAVQQFLHILFRLRVIKCQSKSPLLQCNGCKTKSLPRNFLLMSIKVDWLITDYSADSEKLRKVILNHLYLLDKIISFKPFWSLLSQTKDLKFETRSFEHVVQSFRYPQTRTTHLFLAALKSPIHQSIHPNLFHRQKSIENKITL